MFRLQSSVWRRCLIWHRSRSERVASVYEALSLWFTVINHLFLCRAVCTPLRAVKRPHLHAESLLVYCKLFIIVLICFGTNSETVFLLAVLHTSSPGHKCPFEPKAVFCSLFKHRCSFALLPWKNPQLQNL